MKIIDKNGRLFGKVSFIDILVIAIVAVVVIVVGAKKQIIEQVTGATATTSVEYQIIARDIRETHAKLYQIGDELHPDSVNAPGIITAVEIKPASAPSQLADGTYTMGKIESKVDLIVTIRADCSYSNGHYYAGRAFEINVNQESVFLTKYATVKAYVYSVNPAE
ncbi:MAG: DUF4330 domain-containing protein [Oscillospiraceae bacterium]|jgi:hypothetical protein|nr:DUF4330 domain-containing protein [Oscillospiraceae bacterium]